MPRTVVETTRHDLDLAFEAVSDALKRAAVHLTGDAEDAVAKSANEVMRTATALRQHYVPVAEKAARKIGDEVKEHPIEAIAAAITAAAALAGVIAATYHKAD